MSGLRILLLVTMVGLLLAALPPDASAQFVPTPPPTTFGLSGTHHDFTLRPDPANPTKGLCTYCHTPHKAPAPYTLLWNHTLSANTFSWTVPATTAGTTFPSFAGSYAGTTAKCLSCHDGSVSVGDIAWFDDAPRTGTAAISTHMIPATNADGSINGGRTAADGGGMDGNHPVAMPYPFGQVSNTYNGVSNGPDLVPAEWVGDPRTRGIRLYADGGAALTGTAGGTNVGIECTSCHEPHNGASVQGPYFLRGSLVGNSTSDYLCTKCHVK